MSAKTGIAAVIPAAGLGTRFLPLTRAVPKEMLPIGSKPALEVLVDEALEAGAESVTVIISPAKELVRRYFEADEKYARLIRWVYQTEQRGLGHAVLQAAEPLAGARQLLVLLGDAIVSGCRASSEMVALSRQHDGASVIGAEHVAIEKVSRYGILAVEPDGLVTDMVEKPAVEEAPSDLAVAGRYLLDGEIFEYLKNQTPGKGGEIQLTDAIRRMLEKKSVYAYVYPGKRHDIGNPQGYYETLKAINGD